MFSFDLCLFNSWFSSIDSLIYFMWFTFNLSVRTCPGQEAGNALADVLFGVVNPSGRLPMTVPNTQNELQLSESQWPGINLQVKFGINKMYWFCL